MQKISSSLNYHPFLEIVMEFYAKVPYEKGPLQLHPEKNTFDIVKLQRTHKFCKNFLINKGMDKLYFHLTR